MEEEEEEGSWVSVRSLLAGSPFVSRFVVEPLDHRGEIASLNSTGYGWSIQASHILSFAAPWSGLNEIIDRRRTAWRALFVNLQFIFHSLLIELPLCSSGSG